MMKHNALAVAVKFAMVGVMAGSLAACGGGGSSSDSGADGGSSSGSAASSGTSVGPVSGFGSVYVNGIRFATNGSVVGDDGIERETQLEKGMIVKVSGQWDGAGQGEADRLDYDDSLRGPLESAVWNGPDGLDGEGALVVVGQDVAVDDQTVFKGATKAQLEAAAPGTYRVRVSAWRLHDGTFRASFVGVKAFADSFGDDSEIELEGPIENLDATAQTFTIGGQAVDFQSAMFDDELSRDNLANGAVVEVEGYLQDGVLVAEEIDGEDNLFDEDDDVEISGAIAGDYDAAAGQFRLNGITIQVDNETDFDDGLRAGDLADGLLIEVEGEFRNGVLVAEDIEARDGDASLDGVIESKADDALMVSGVRVLLTGSTLITDDDDDDRITLRTGDIESLIVGDVIEVEGRARSTDGGYLDAIRIERDNDDDDDTNSPEMEGRITAMDAGSVTVMGLTLLSGGVDTSAFSIGDPVEVEYSMTAGGDYVVGRMEQDD